MTLQLEYQGERRGHERHPAWHRIETLEHASVQERFSMLNIYKNIVYQIVFIERLGNHYNELLFELCKFAYLNRLYGQAKILKNMVDLSCVKDRQAEFHLLASKIEKKSENSFGAMQHLEKINTKDPNILGIALYRIEKERYAMNFQSLDKTIKEINAIQRSYPKQEAINFKVAQFLDYKLSYPTVKDITRIISLYSISILSGNRYTQRSFPRVIKLFIDQIQGFQPSEEAYL